MKNWKKHLSGSLLLPALLCTACTYNAYIDPTLQTAGETLLIERGKNPLKRDLHIGDYTTSEVDWGKTSTQTTKGEKSPVKITVNPWKRIPDTVYQHRQHRYSFRLSDTIGNRAFVTVTSSVDATAYLREKDRNSIYNSIDEKYRYAAAIVLNDGADTWDFELQNADKDNPFAPASGLITNDLISIKIIEEQRKNDGSQFPAGAVFAYNFVLNGETVGMMTYSKPRRLTVLKPLHPSIRMVIASAVVAIVWREKLEPDYTELYK